MSESHTQPTPKLSPDEVHAQYQIETLTLTSPFRWLRLGLNDLLAHPGISLFYGVSFCLMAWALKTVFQQQPRIHLVCHIGVFADWPVLWPWACMT